LGRFITSDPTAERSFSLCRDFAPIFQIATNC